MDSVFHSKSVSYRVSTRSVAGLVLGIALCLPGADTQAQSPEGYDIFAGQWWRNDWSGVEIAADHLTQLTAEDRYEVTAATCPNGFEHVFARRTPAEIADFYGLDPTDEWASGLSDPEGEPAGPALLAALPAGDVPVATLWNYCAAETHGGALFFPDTTAPGDEAGLTAIVAGDGVAMVEHYRRTPPPPDNAAFDDFERQEIQTALQERGHYAGAIDGALGPASERAIAAWQTAIGAEPTGALSRSQFIRLVYQP